MPRYRTLPPTCAPGRCPVSAARPPGLPGVALLSAVTVWPWACRHGHAGPGAGPRRHAVADAARPRGQARAEHHFTQLRELSRQMVFGYHDQIANLPGSLATREALLRTHSGTWTAWPPGWALAGRPAATGARAGQSYSRIAALQGRRLCAQRREPAGLARQPRRALALVPYYLDNTASASAATRRLARGCRDAGGPCHPGHARRPARRDQRPRWTTPAGSTKAHAPPRRTAAPRPSSPPVLGRLGLLLNGNRCRRSSVT